MKPHDFVPLAGRAALWIGAALLFGLLGRHVRDLGQPAKLVAVAAIVTVVLCLFEHLQRRDLRRELDERPLAARLAVREQAWGPSWSARPVAYGGYAVAVFAVAYGLSYRQWWVAACAVLPWWLGMRRFEQLTRRRLLAERQPRSRLGAQGKLGSIDEAALGLDLMQAAVFERIHQIAVRFDNPREEAQVWVAASGALAGYACQAFLRETAAKAGRSGDDAFVVVEAGGRRYFYGDALNHVLCEGSGSLWASVQAIAAKLPHAVLPDRDEMFAHVTSTVGTAAFGVPRAQQLPNDKAKPVLLLRELWGPVTTLISRADPSPHGWAVVLNLVAQTALQAASQRIDASVALRIMLESAIAMAKVDLGAQAPIHRADPVPTKSRS